MCRCVRLKKSPFLATNTHKTVKQGPAKENKFNIVLCKPANQLSGQRKHSLIGSMGHTNAQIMCKCTNNCPHLIDLLNKI